MTVPSKIDLKAKFGLFTDHWSPKVVAEMDDYEIKLVKVEGDFVWHSHADVDELFLIVEGTLVVAFDDGDVTLEAGELLVIPKGTRHKPFAPRECRMMVIERRGTINTGDAESVLTVREATRL